MAGSMDAMTPGDARAYGRAGEGTEHNETAVLEEDIRQTQERLGDTVEEIGERFNPRRLKEEVKHDIRDATIGRMENMAQQTAELVTGAQRSIAITMRENPIPVAMVGVGLAWLIWNGSQRRGTGSGSNKAHTRSIDESADRGALARARERAGEVVDSLKDKGSMLAEQTQRTVGRVEEGAQDVAGLFAEESRVQVRKLENIYQENPLVMGAALFALGLAGGLAVPATRKEAELVGETRDQLVDKVREVADDTKAKVQEVAGRVMHEAEVTASDAAHAVGLMS